jgi:hypothetical protein
MCIESAECRQFVGAALKADFVSMDKNKNKRAFLYGLVREEACEVATETAVTPRRYPLRKTVEHKSAGFSRSKNVLASLWRSTASGGLGGQGQHVCQVRNLEQDMRHNIGAAESASPLRTKWSL